MQTELILTRTVLHLLCSFILKVKLVLELLLSCQDPCPWASELENLSLYVLFVHVSMSKQLGFTMHNALFVEYVMYIGLFQKKFTPPRQKACWKISRERGLTALEIQTGGEL